MAFIVGPSEIAWKTVDAEHRGDTSRALAAVRGAELPTKDWEAAVLPLNYARIFF
jgi:hypothetical protein